MEKEKIERVAIGMLPYSDEECADSNYVLGKNVGFKRGFTAGARWRINEAWHEAGEKPDTCNLLLLMFTNGVIVTGRYEKWGFSYFTKENVQNAEVEKWAYITDLLPEKRKEAEP